MTVFTGLSSEDVALNGVTLNMVGAAGPNPTLPELPARARTGKGVPGLSLPGLSFGFFGETEPMRLSLSTLREDDH